MIYVDNGHGLRRLLAHAASGSCVGERLEVAVPFFDAHGQLWNSLVAATEHGVRLRLFTRLPGSACKHAALRKLISAGARVIFLRKLHAKVFVWIGEDLGHVEGYVGSHNMTLASECCYEVGVVFRGDGEVESLLLRDVMAMLDRWEQRARKAG